MRVNSIPALSAFAARMGSLQPVQGSTSVDLQEPGSDVTKSVEADNEAHSVPAIDVATVENAVAEENADDSDDLVVMTGFSTPSPPVNGLESKVQRKDELVSRSN
jgi:hypothetical protein